MTREELMALLRDPDQTEKSADELNRLIEEYSYFHSGHQLYVQSLKKTDETRLTHQLNKSALNVRDRGLLYNYLNRPNIFRQQTTDPGNVEEAAPPFAPGNAFVSPESDITNIRYEEAQPSADHTRLLGEDGTLKDTGIYTVAEEKIMSDSELLAIIQRQLGELNAESPEAEAQPVEADNREKAPESESKNAVNSEVQTILEETFSAESQNVEIVAGDADDNKPADVCPNEKPDTEIPAENSIETLISTLQKQKESEIVEIQDIAVQSIENEEENIGNDLIDSFIKTNPKIVPTNTDFEVDLSESLKDSSDMATETLADIYVSQGHIQKAIEIYEHLILKYPEKHIYFAAQINRLKQEIKK